MTISLLISETDARILNTSLTTENKIDKFRSSRFGVNFPRSIVFVINSVNGDRFLEFTEPNRRNNCTISLLYEIISLWEKHKEM